MTNEKSRRGEGRNAEARRRGIIQGTAGRGAQQHRAGRVHAGGRHAHGDTARAAAVACPSAPPLLLWRERRPPPSGASHPRLRQLRLAGGAGKWWQPMPLRRGRCQAAQPPACLPCARSLRRARLQHPLQLGRHLIQLAGGPVEQRRQRPACGGRRAGGRAGGRAARLLPQAFRPLRPAGRSPSLATTHATHAARQTAREPCRAQTRPSPPARPAPSPLGSRQVGSRSSSKNGCAMPSSALTRLVGEYTSSLPIWAGRGRRAGWAGGGGRGTEGQSHAAASPLCHAIPFPAYCMQPTSPKGTQRTAERPAQSERSPTQTRQAAARLRGGPSNLPGKRRQPPRRPAAPHPPGPPHRRACAWRRPWPRGAP